MPQVRAIQEAAVMLPADQMLAGLLGSPSVCREHTLERVDHDPELFGVQALVASLKLAHRRPTPDSLFPALLRTVPAHQTCNNAHPPHPAM
ncbi:MAG: hypothetical protein ACREOY_01150 [Candidatus Dormibacteraceae bacterium]